MGRTLAELISELCSHIAPAKAYTLVQAMLGGISWGEVSDLLMEIDVTLGFVDYDSVMNCHDISMKIGEIWM